MGVDVAGADPSASTISWCRWARLFVWLLTNLRVVGAERVPARGGVLLAANHVSFLTRSSLRSPWYDCGRRKVRFPPSPTCSITRWLAGSCVARG